MLDFNCIGRLSEKPEMKKTASGINFCNLVITSNKPFANADGEVEKEDFSITCWKNIAEEVIEKYKPGVLLQIKGRAVANNYRSNDDKFYYKTDLVAERVLAFE